MSDNYTESPEGQAELEQLERDERERQEADAALVAPREPLISDFTDRANKRALGITDEDVPSSSGAGPIPGTSVQSAGSFTLPPCENCAELQAQRDHALTYSGKYQNGYDAGQKRAAKAHQWLLDDRLRLNRELRQLESESAALVAGLRQQAAQIRADFEKFAVDIRALEPLVLPRDRYNMPSTLSEILQHTAKRLQGSEAEVAGLRQEVEILRVTVRGDQQVEKALDAEVAGLRQELHEAKASLELADRKVTDAERLLRQSERNRAEDAASHLDEQQALRDKLAGVLAGLRGLITQWRADEVDAANHCAIADQDTYDGWDTKRRLCDQHGTALEARLDPGRPARSLEET